MEIEVADGFIQNGKTRNIQQEAGNYSVDQQENG